MIAKIGEPILIGKGIEWESINPFASMGMGEPVMKCGGDRSYIHRVYVCIASEEDRCVILPLKNRGEEEISKYQREPRTILYSEFPVTKCSSETLRAMTGLELTDNLLEIANSCLQT